MQPTAKKKKPRVGRVAMPDGSTRLAGSDAAAKWLGVSRTTLKRIIDNPDGNEHSAALNAQVRREFPEFFTETPVTARESN